MAENHQKSSKTILEFAQAVKEIGTDGLVKEFLQIPRKNSEATFAIARKSVNLKKNRYLFLLSGDKSRVALFEETGDVASASDFINANFVDGYEQKNAYIATQGYYLYNAKNFCDKIHLKLVSNILGPLPSTTADFWQMIWEQKCLVIVMVTGLIEDEVVKCHQYWEMNPGETLVYGNYEIKTVSVELNEGYSVSSLELRNLMVRSKMRFNLLLTESSMFRLMRLEKWLISTTSHGLISKLQFQQKFF